MNMCFSLLKRQASNQTRSQLLCDYMTSHVGKAYTITVAAAADSDTLGLDVACVKELFSSVALSYFPFQIFSYLGAAAKGIDFTVNVFLTTLIKC